MYLFRSAMPIASFPRHSFHTPYDPRLLSRCIPLGAGTYYNLNVVIYISSTFETFFASVCKLYKVPILRFINAYKYEEMVIIKYEKTSGHE